MAPMVKITIDRPFMLHAVVLLDFLDVLRAVSLSSNWLSLAKFFGGIRYRGLKDMINEKLLFVSCFFDHVVWSHVIC